MLDLALNNTGEYIKIKSIAERQEISEKYLEQIVSSLKHAGFLKSVRGSRGGYKLSKSLDQYTVGMILRLTEGSLAPVASLDEEEQTFSKGEDYITLEIWKQLDEAIKGVVDRITLADLVDWHMEKATNEYFI